MPRLTKEQRDELDALRALIGAINRFLGWLTTESGAVPRDMVEAFLRVYSILQARLAQASQELGGIKDTEDPLWRRLDDAGLNGEALRLKLAIWERLAGGPSAAAATPRGRGGRLLGKVVGYVNSLLGSLAAVFPPVELAKEYKDGVEAVIDHQRAIDPPAGILNLR